MYFMFDSLWLQSGRASGMASGVKLCQLINADSKTLQRPLEQQSQNSPTARSMLLCTLSIQGPKCQVSKYFLFIFIMH